MSGGVVYSAEGNGALGKFSLPFPIGAGGEIPPGVFMINVAWNAMVDGTLTPMPPGICQSDGQATTAPGTLIYRLGAGPPVEWPWPLPWPLIAMPWAPWP